MLDVEGEASVLLAPFERPPSARALVEYYHGPECIVRMQRLVGGAPADLGHHDGRAIFILRSRQSREDFRWNLLHEFAEHHLKHRLHYRDEDIEEQAQALTAALVMPRAEFRRVLWSNGGKFPAVAGHFFATETAVALRMGEVGAASAVAVVAPTHVRVRAREEFALPGEVELRRLANARRLPRGLARVVLSDDKRRRALLAETG